MSRRILIAPDKFKGSLSAPQAAEAIAEGIRRLDPGAEVDLCPIADGGEGFMEAAARALDVRWVSCPAVDALGRDIESRYLVSDTSEGPVAVLEMAETAGLWRLEKGERDPLEATTRGVGMQMVHAVREHAVIRIVLGLGGSATNDGGSGMAAALGVAFLDEKGSELSPIPSNSLSIHRIDFTNQIGLPEILAACDVESPLLGAKGATAVFATQKGASIDEMPMLEAALAHLVRVSEGEQCSFKQGAGAAGGLGFGLLWFAGARLVPGFELLAGLLKIETRIRAADLVVTGEGALDLQSLSGKGPVALARMARKYGVPVFGFCGSADPGVRESGEFEEIHALVDQGDAHELMMSQASSLLSELVVKSGILEEASR